MTKTKKKKFTSEALVIALKEKTEDFFYHISSLFPGLENYWAKLQDFFKNSRLCTNPVTRSLTSSNPNQWKIKEGSK